MTDSDSTIARADRQAGAWVRIVAMCLGAAGALHLTGMVGVYQAILDPLPRTAALVVAVALLSAALGPWLPQRAIGRRLRSASATRPRASDQTRWDLLPHAITPVQQGLLWVVLAVACLGAGTTGLILLRATGPIEVAHRWATERFFLSATELLAVDGGAVVAGVAVPWLMIGLALACLYVLAAGQEAPGRAGGGLAGAVLIGAGLGLAVCQWEGLLGSPGRTALVGALPLFLATMVAVARAGSRRPADAPGPSYDDQLPDWAPEAGYALLATLVAWGGLVGSGLATWPRVVATGLRVLPAVEPLLVAWLALSVGIGIVVGGWLARRTERPVAGCGPMMVLAGVAAGLAIAGSAVAGVAGQRSAVAGEPLATGLVLTALAIGGLGAGGVFPYLKRALIAQSGSPSVASAQVVTAALTGAAIWTVAGPCWIVPAAGTLVALAVGALAGLAAGGLLIIFDVGGPTGHRGWRLVGVFGALVVFMIGLPGVSNDWLRWDRQIAALREGSWLTASLIRHEGHVDAAVEPRPDRVVPPGPPGVAMVKAVHAVIQLRSPIDRCWLISAGDLMPTHLNEFHCRRVEAGCYDPLGAKLFQTLREERGLAPVVDCSPDSALRRLRWTRARYDLILVVSVPGGHSANAVIWSVENLQRAMRRVAPRGLLAGLVRPADHGRAGLATIAATFAAALPGDSRAALVGRGTDQVLVLLAGADPPARWDWPGAAQVGMHRVGPVKSFLRVAGGAVPNSLRAPSLAVLREPVEGGLQLTRYISERDDWRALRPSVRPVPVWPPAVPPGGAPRSSAGPARAGTLGAPPSPPTR